MLIRRSPVAGIDDSGGRGHRPRLQLRRQTVERVTSLWDGLAGRSSTVAPTFGPSRSTIHTCWPCSNELRIIIGKTPSSVAGLSSTSTTIAPVFPSSVSAVRCNQLRLMHGHRSPVFSLEVFGARPPAEHVRTHKRIISLACLDQFSHLGDMRFDLVALKNAIQEPNNKTVRQQNQRAYHTRSMPEMANLNRNQHSSRENH